MSHQVNAGWYSYGHKDCRMSIGEISSLKNKYIEASYKFTDLQ